MTKLGLGGIAYRLRKEWLGLTCTRDKSEKHYCYAQGVRGSHGCWSWNFVGILTEIENWNKQIIERDDDVGFVLGAIEFVLKQETCSYLVGNLHARA